MASRNKITESELAVISALWDIGGPAPMTEILSRMADSGWEASTVKTFVARLVKKGAVTQEKREVYYYSPAITREDYGRSAASKLKDELYRGSLGLMVSSLVQDEKLTRQDIDELYAILKKAEEEL